MLKSIIRFWSQEHSLTALLVVLVVKLFVLVPTIGSGFIVSMVSDLVFLLILIAGLFTMSHRRSIQVFFSVFIVLSIITHIQRAFFNLPSLIALDFSFSTVAVLGMLIVTLRMVYQDGPVTPHRIRGSVAGYLMISIIFARIYALINHVAPYAFNVSSALTQFSTENPESFYYFSVVTLTTVGFGDMTPVAPVARSFVMAEALIGQLYPAILIARLVSLSLLNNPKD